MESRVKSRTLLLSVIIVVLISGRLFAEKKKLPPIHFVADKVIAAERVTFISGHVKVYVKDYILTAKRITLYTSGDSREVYKIKAMGNVKIMGKNRFAISDMAIFYRGTGKVILKGNPRIWEGTDELRGKEIIMYLEQKKVIVKGARGRFTPSHIDNLGR